MEADHHDEGKSQPDSHEEISKMVSQVATEYSNYFNVDTSKIVKQFEDSIEENLILLEDFCSILDVIRNENSACIEQLMPTIAEKSKEMDALYEKIDNLESFVKLVRDQVKLMEEELEKAEQSFASSSKVKKFLTSLLLVTNKKVPSQSGNTSGYDKPKFGFTDIFKTHDFIQSNNDSTGGVNNGTEAQCDETNDHKESQSSSTS